MNTPADELEHSIQQAHLLIVEHRFDEAKGLLLTLRARYARNADVEDLLARIASTDQAVKAEAEKHRAFRYQLQLQSCGSRAVWWTGGGLLVLAGIVVGGQALVYSFGHGFAATVSTMVNTGSRYNPRYEPWFYPVYFNLLLGLGLLAVGAVALLVVSYAARGAAQWEELDETPDESSGRWWPSWPWFP